MSVLIFQDTYLSLYHDDTLNCIYADWIGFQTLATVQEGCERLLEAMVQHNSHKILNDNTRVEGIWSSAAEWVGIDWFPRMRQSGMTCFAWIYSPSMFSRLSADKSLRFTYDTTGIEVFEDMESARNWLVERQPANTQ